MGTLVLFLINNTTKKRTPIPFISTNKDQRFIRISWHVYRLGQVLRIRTNGPLSFFFYLKPPDDQACREPDFPCLKYDLKRWIWRHHHDISMWHLLFVCYDGCCVRLSDLQSHTFLPCLSRETWQMTTRWSPTDRRFGRKDLGTDFRQQERKQTMPLSRILAVLCSEKHFLLCPLWHYTG